MLGKQYKTYQTLNLDNIAPHQFSELYSLNPIGIGQPLIESLTSYISRLAFAHCVYPGILMERVVQLTIKKNTAVQKSIKYIILLAQLMVRELWD